MENNNMTTRGGNNRLIRVLVEVVEEVLIGIVAEKVT
jgi:hypothetical protein